MFVFIISNQLICMHCHLPPAKTEEDPEVGMNYWDIKSIVFNIIAKSYVKNTFIVSIVFNSHFKYCEYTKYTQFLFIRVSFRYFTARR